MLGHRQPDAAGLTVAYVHVDYDFCYTVNAASGEFSILFACRVASGAGKFDDAVMYLYAH